MKRMTLALLLLFSITTIAQNGINYKALIKDNLGAVVANQTIDVKFTIIADTGPTDVYVETHTGATTDANGIVILTIGSVITPTLGVFADIAWSSDTHSLKVEIDIEQDASFVDIGTTQFMSVPYALQAKTAENTFSGDYNDLTNQPTAPTYSLNTFYAELGGYVIDINSDGKHGVILAMKDQGYDNWYNANNLLNNPDNHDTDGAQFRDWRLPSKRELNLMYLSYLNGNPTNLAGATYWSSSEFKFDYAWLHYFFSGQQDDVNKVNPYNIRTVRSF